MLPNTVRFNVTLRHDAKSHGPGYNATLLEGSTSFTPDWRTDSVLPVIGPKFEIVESNFFKWNDTLNQGSVQHFSYVAKPLVNDDLSNALPEGTSYHNATLTWRSSPEVDFCIIAGINVNYCL